MTYSVGEADPSQVDYRQTFIGHIRRGLDSGLARMADRAAAVSDQQRRQYGQLLRYGLQEPASAVTACQLLLALSPHMAHASVRDEWATLLTTGWQAAQAAGEPATALRIAVELGELSRQMGKLNEAEGWLAQAWALRQPHDDLALIGRILHRRAYLFSQRGDRVEALALAEEAVRLLAPGTAEWAMAQFTLGVVLDESSPSTQVLEKIRNHFHAALEVWQRLGDLRWSAKCIQNLGRLSRIEGNATIAKRLLLHASDLLRQIDDPWSVASLQISLGNVYLATKEYQMALDQYAYALRHMRSVHDVRHVAIVLNNIGMILAEQGHFNDAETYYLDSISYWLRAGDTKSRVNVEDNLGLLYTMTGAFSDAIRVLEVALAELAVYRDSDAKLLQEEIESHIKDAKSRLLNLDTPPNHFPSLS